MYMQNTESSKLYGKKIVLGEQLPLSVLSVYLTEIHFYRKDFTSRSKFILLKSKSQLGRASSTRKAKSESQKMPSLEKEW